jgi:hypothetical protein
MRAECSSYEILLTVPGSHDGLTGQACPGTNMTRQRPYRVILWGAGTLAGAILRQLRDRPDFELVGMWCYSAAKAGTDAGTIAGIAPLGVKATDNKEEIFATEADCAIVCVKDSNDHTQLDRDVVRLLESGKNVVSSTSYVYPPMRGAAYADRLLQACLKGGVSLHAAGEHPSMICERLALTLTGFCTQLEHVTVHEYADIGGLRNPSMLAAAGIGRTAEEIEASSGQVLSVWEVLFKDMIGFMGFALYDAPPDRITLTAKLTPDIIDQDFSLSPDFVVRRGTAACINLTFQGSVDGRHFITLHMHWAYGVQNSPAKDLRSGQTHHVVEIEGKPISVRMVLDGQASFARDIIQDKSDPTIPIYHLAVAPIIQAVPMVCAAAPGFVFQTALTHYKPDYRICGNDLI